MSSSSRNDWIIYQLIDATLPTGGFAHSYGLEAAIQQKWITTQEDLMQFLDSLLHQTVNMMCPLVYSGYTCYPSIEKWRELDEYTSAILTNHITCRASLALGLAFLRTAHKTFSCNLLDDVQKYITKANTSMGHHGPLFGFICKALGCSAEESQRMFMYCTLRDVLSAATRLNVIGPMESSRLLHVLSNGAESMLQAGLNRPLSEIHQCSPLLDLIQGLQDQLYSRIFNT